MRLARRPSVKNGPERPVLPGLWVTRELLAGPGRFGVTMGQKVRPTGFRLGIMTDWLSRWYANKQDFAELLVEDQGIRKFVRKRFAGAGISRIRIDRTREKVTVFVHAEKVGVIIGPKGQKIDKLTEDLQHKFRRLIEVKTMEVNQPELDPNLVAQRIAEELQKRQSFRKTMKKAVENSMNAGAKGVRIQMAGRLGGAEMARTESAMDGSIPLSTLRARVEYGFAEASTAQGNIGIKVWINNGDYLNPEEDSDGSNAQTRQVPKKSTRQNKR